MVYVNLNIIHGRLAGGHFHKTRTIKLSSFRGSDHRIPTRYSVNLRGPMLPLMTSLQYIDLVMGVLHHFFESTSLTCKKIVSNLGMEND